MFPYIEEVSVSAPLLLDGPFPIGKQLPSQCQGNKPLWTVNLKKPFIFCNYSALLSEKVEDITATQKAMVLEMENSHTAAIAALQEEYEQRVQGNFSTRPRQGDPGMGDDNICEKPNL